MKERRVVVLIAMKVFMKKIKIVLTLFTLSLAMVSCGKTMVKSELDNDEEIRLNNNEFVDLIEGEAMPNVVIDTNKDLVFDLSKTTKPVLINFWATWCPPCRGEMPGLQELYEEYGHDIDFVLINLGESKEKIQDFLIENDTYTFPIGYDQNQIYGDKFQIMAIPTTFIVGKDKILKNNIVGARPKEQFKEYIEKVINE